VRKGTLSPTREYSIASRNKSRDLSNLSPKSAGVRTLGSKYSLQDLIDQFEESSVKSGNNENCRTPPISRRESRQSFRGDTSDAAPLSPSDNQRFEKRLRCMKDTYEQSIRSKEYQIEMLKRQLANSVHTFEDENDENDENFEKVHHSDAPPNSRHLAGERKPLEEIGNQSADSQLLSIRLQYEETTAKLIEEKSAVMKRIIDANNVLQLKEMEVERLQAEIKARDAELNQDEASRELVLDEMKSAISERLQAKIDKKLSAVKKSYDDQLRISEKEVEALRKELQQMEQQDTGESSLSSEGSSSGPSWGAEKIAETVGEISESTLENSDGSSRSSDNDNEQNTVISNLTLESDIQQLQTQNDQEEPLCLSPSNPAAVTRSVAEAAKLASSLGVGPTLHSSQQPLQRAGSILGSLTYCLSIMVQRQLRVGESGHQVHALVRKLQNCVNYSPCIH